MNLLIDELPDLVEIDGSEYAIDTDFRACLRVILAFEDTELTNLEKWAILLNNLYPERPSDLRQAVEQALKFLDGGRKRDDDDVPGPRLYSFAQDASLIFAAFRQTHGIDLETAQLHWWKFLALFSDLGADTTFCNLVSLRKRLKTGRASKEERQAARELGEIVNLPEPGSRTLAEREQEAEFLRLVKERHAKKKSQ